MDKHIKTYEKNGNEEIRVEPDEMRAGFPVGGGAMPVGRLARTLPAN